MMRAGGPVAQLVGVATCFAFRPDPEQPGRVGRGSVRPADRPGVAPQFRAAMSLDEQPHAIQYLFQMASVGLTSGVRPRAAPTRFAAS